MSKYYGYGYGYSEQYSRRTKKIVSFLILIVLVFLTVNIFTDIVIKKIPQKAIIYSSAVLISIIALANPESALYTVIAVSAIYNPYMKAEFGKGATLAVILLAFSFVMIVVKRILIQNKRLHTTATDVIILIFFALCILSTVKTIEFTNAKRRILEYILLFMGYYLSLIIFKKKAIFNQFFTVLFLSSFVGSAYGIYTRFANPFYGSVERAYGSFINPNSFGLYLCLILPFNITFLSMKIKEIDRKRKIFLFFNLIVLAMALFFSKSRTSWLGFMISSTYLFMQVKRKAALIIIITIFFSIIFVVPEFSDRLFHLVDLQDSALQARFVLWEKAANQVIENMTTGIGIGNFKEQPLPFNSKYFDISFNMYLTICAELGIFGILLFVGMLFTTTVYFRSRLYLIKDPFLLAIGHGAFAVFIGNLFQGLFEDTILAIYTNWLFGIVWGIIFAVIHISRKNIQKRDHDVLEKKAIPISTQ
ncbi:O-antigen ligase family protein [bacterium]|nr:O-antigen ligase family protein [bacterium]